MIVGGVYGEKFTGGEGSYNIRSDEEDIFAQHPGNFDNSGMGFQSGHNSHNDTALMEPAMMKTSDLQ